MELSPHKDVDVVVATYIFSTSNLEENYLMWPHSLAIANKELNIMKAIQLLANQEVSDDEVLDSSNHTA